MKRWWLMSAVGAVSALVFLQLSGAESSPPAAAEDSPPQRAEAQPQPPVTVEQVLVEAEVVQPIARQEEPPSAPLALANERPAATNGWTNTAPVRISVGGLHRASDAAAPPPLFERAKRAFLGDGRHRPEPFPRVKDN